MRGESEGDDNIDNMLIEQIQAEVNCNVCSSCSLCIKVVLLIYANICAVFVQQIKKTLMFITRTKKPTFCC